MELQSLRQLFRSIESYYYPSNTGGWSDVLAHFLRSIAHHYAERVGRGLTLLLLPPSSSSPPFCSATLPHRFSNQRLNAGDVMQSGRGRCPWTAS